MFNFCWVSIFFNILIANISWTVAQILRNRHFSHVTKSRIFKNLNLTKKSRSQLSQHFPEKPFQAFKITFKSPKLIVQELLSYGHLLKDKRLKFRFLRAPTLQVLVRGSSAPKTIWCDKNRYFFIILDLVCPETKNLVYFLWEKVYIKKFCSVKARGFWFKNWNFP